MKKGGIAGCSLLLAVLCGAQQGRGGRGASPPGTQTAATDATLALVQDLYRQARQTLPAMPPALAPQSLAAIASDEMRLFPSQGLQDYSAAFALAQALRPPDSSTDAAGQARQALKEQVELDVVSAFARQGDADQALALVRLADVPKAPLYDQLIMLTERRPADTDDAGRSEGSRPAAPASPGAATANQPITGPTPRIVDRRFASSAAAAANQQMVDAVFDLVQECKRADGTYPYRGVAAVLRRPQFDALNRIVLTRDGYLWAGNESDPTQMRVAVTFLQAGHRAVPELDGELETALVAMLEKLGQGDATGPFGAESGVGNSLMELLAQVDAPRAAAMATSFPNLGSQAMTQSNLGPLQLSGTAAANGSGGVNMRAGAYQVWNIGGGAGGGDGNMGLTFSVRMSPASSGGADGGGGGNTNPAFSFSTTVTAGAPADSSEASGATQFLALVAQAESLQRRQPDEALGVANQAAGMLDDTLWATETPAAARLAALYAQLGASADSARVLARCLDEADQQARTADANYLSSADPAQQTQGLESAQSSVLEVYSMAARLDLATTAQRAEDAPFVLLKPLVLTRVALVAQVGQHPVPVPPIR